MTDHLHSYPKIYALGHRIISDLLTGDVVVQEKVDGSQFSFGKTFDGELVMRSKGAVVYPENAGMFKQAVESVQAIEHLLKPGIVIRGEYLSKPKHNVLCYNRVPKNHIVIFDVEVGDGQMYQRPDHIQQTADTLGFETVPLLYEGPANMLSSPEWVKAFLENKSFLGGQLVEGIVIKNYSVFTIEKKVAMGKYVSERFKEIHGGEWRKSNPTRGDVVQEIITALKTPARWDKAVQHLREKGELDNSPRDIGKLFKEVATDVLAEEKDAIAEKLFKHAWPNISRGITGGLAEWYKNRLLENQFEAA